jgi:dihydrofolate reductase
MRRLIVNSRITLDGFMAGPDNDLDFMTPDAQLDEEMTSRLMAVADTVVIGRKSFSVMAEHWMADGSEIAAWLNKTPKVVLSTDPALDVSAWSNSTLAAGDGAEQVRRLKATAGDALVVFGGVATVRGLVTAGLVDEYWLKITPVVVGHGGAMFSGLTSQQTLKLRSSKAYPSGMVAAVYES